MGATVMRYPRAYQALVGVVRSIIATGNIPSPSTGYDDSVFKDSGPTTTTVSSLFAPTTTRVNPLLAATRTIRDGATIGFGIGDYVSQLPGGRSSGGRVGSVPRVAALEGPQEGGSGSGNGAVSGGGDGTAAASGGGRRLAEDSDGDGGEDSATSGGARRLTEEGGSKGKGGRVKVGLTFNFIYSDGNQVCARGGGACVCVWGGACVCV